MRKVIHIDMDAFYASVEQRDNPELRGKPVMVGWSAEARGVVVSASYEARRFGVRSAMSAWKAVRLCPGLIIVPSRMSEYVAIHKRLMTIYADVTDLIEPLSLDEAYLDVTTNKLSEPLAAKVAVYLRKRIKDELALTASAGVGPNKFIAKCASDLRKPDALVVIPPDKVADFVRELPVEKLWGVGPATTKKLHGHNLKTAADIRNCELALLEKILGSHAHFLRQLAHGEDSREVHSHREAKSRGAETTFEKDVLDVNILRATLGELSADVARSLKKLGKDARSLTLKVRYHDFKTVTRSRTLAQTFREQAALHELACALLTMTEAGRVPVRLLGLSASGWETSAEAEEMSDQLPLF